MRRTGYLLALLVFVVDHLSKYWVVNILRLPERAGVEVLPFFSLTFVGNVGVSMGLFPAGTPNGRWFLVAVTAAIAAAVVVWMQRERNRLDIAALGLVLGGALGNIVDRIRLGYVVDFLHFHWHEHSFWVFNVADAAISIGVILLLARAVLAPKG